MGHVYHGISCRDITERVRCQSWCFLPWPFWEREGPQSGCRLMFVAGGRSGNSAGLVAEHKSECRALSF